MKEKKNNWLPIITIVLAVLLIASVSYTIYSNKDVKKDNSKTDNITITEEEKEKTVKEIEAKFKLDDFSIKKYFYNDAARANLKEYVYDTATPTKCNDSIKKELIEKGFLTKKDYTNTDYKGEDEYTYLSACSQLLSCDEMSFYSTKEITDVLKKYFGNNAKLDLSNDPNYLEKNDVKTFLDSCGGDADYIDEITKIDSSMPTKDTVIFTYSVKITEDEKTTEEKFSLTFKKEDSNWVYSSYKKI